MQDNFFLEIIKIPTLDSIKPTAMAKVYLGLIPNSIQTIGKGIVKFYSFQIFKSSNFQILEFLFLNK